MRRPRLRLPRLHRPARPNTDDGRIQVNLLRGTDYYTLTWKPGIDGPPIRISVNHENYAGTAIDIDTPVTLNSAYDPLMDMTIYVDQDCVYNKNRNSRT